MSLSPNVQLSSTTKIDILIPAIEKDLGTLPFVIDAVRKYVKHPIGEILIVAPKRKKMIEICRRKGCKFVDEDKVLPLTKKDINYRSKTWDRSGWLFQQFLKLSGDSICSSNFYLVIDADTVLIRPHTFRSAQKTVFYCRNWSQDEYFKTYKKLLGRKPSSSLSFVTHYMLFEKSKLVQLKRAIESKHGTRWYLAILRNMNKSKQFAFSEFETYGNFIHAAVPSKLILKQALNKGLHMNVTQISKSQVALLSKKYRSISFHKRKDYVRKLQVGRP
ncbi:hypothetical protein GK047_01940 [Paenibacillus sp. SYP-B3998]|uniref:Glycosyltransferase family 2 protein n=1 Tax=Paenibacillus sp. SYP-B3998 TaxID=2678564 RepID=A0A6G3ZRW6_9BACL|nr:DUF6492 family protein [Paenibacillus sp. SYP-B3998]NEW04778.1 hypothetical protein [Paenibacillus sp. SYP-B3998]